MRNPLSDKVVQMKPSGIRKFFDLVQEMPDAISLGVGEPDFDTPWHIREEGIYSLEKGRTFYTSNAGLLELRKAIAHYMYRKYELTYDPAHEIVVTVGGSEGIDLALRAMLNPGDEVILPEPAFVSYLPCVKLADGVPVTIDLKEENHFKLKPEELLAAITDKISVLTYGDTAVCPESTKIFSCIQRLSISFINAFNCFSSASSGIRILSEIAFGAAPAANILFTAP